MHEHENVLWVAILVAILVGCLLALTVQAQPTSVTANIDRTSFGWIYTQGTGGPVQTWLLRCGATPGNYTMQVEFPETGARTIPIGQIVPSVGTYYCAIAGRNAAGTSRLSPEVAFLAGKLLPGDAVQTMQIK